MSYRLGIDVGGTFTDLLLFNEKSGENEEVAFKRQFVLEKSKTGKPQIRWLPLNLIDELKP